MEYVSSSPYQRCDVECSRFSSHMATVLLDSSDILEDNTHVRPVYIDHFDERYNSTLDQTRLEQLFDYIYNRYMPA
jgi:hypothetical protein